MSGRASKDIHLGNRDPSIKSNIHDDIRDNMPFT